MAVRDDASVRVHRKWDDWQSAEVRLDSLGGMHWHQPPGARQPLLHGYIGCTDILSGDIPHACDPDTKPHQLLICVLKRHAIAGVYDELARRAQNPRTAA